MLSIFSSSDIPYIRYIIHGNSMRRTQHSQPLGCLAVAYVHACVVTIPFSGRCQDQPMNVKTTRLPPLLFCIVCLKTVVQGRVAKVIVHSLVQIWVRIVHNDFCYPTLYRLFRRRPPLIQTANPALCYLFTCSTSIFINFLR